VVCSFVGLSPVLAARANFVVYLRVLVILANKSDDDDDDDDDDDVPSVTFWCVFRQQYKHEEKVGSTIDSNQHFRRG